MRGRLTRLAVLFSACWPRGSLAAWSIERAPVRVYCALELLQVGL
jgi:hypothetical protein